MRIFLVGAPADRARMRWQLDGSIEIVAEFSTLRQARAAATDVDAIVMTPAHREDRQQQNSSVSPPPSSAIPAMEGDAIEESLTPREIQVLELLAEGLPNKAIAGRLGISDQTVKFHVASLSGKLGAANRTDAVRRAARRGLIAL
jgi:DNA-binding NarL/FixJ family response regulator